MKVYQPAGLSANSDSPKKVNQNIAPENHRGPCKYIYLAGLDAGMNSVRYRFIINIFIIIIIIIFVIINATDSIIINIIIIIVL